MTMEPGRDAASQCRAAGYRPRTCATSFCRISTPIISPARTAFPNAAIHCARAGLKTAQRGGRFAATRRGMLRALIPADFTKRVRFFEDGRRLRCHGIVSPFE